MKDLAIILMMAEAASTEWAADNIIIMWIGMKKKIQMKRNVRRKRHVKERIKG
jgi:hypothetical protein